MKLGNDIDLSAYGTGEGWMPIGIEGKPFNGHFDGNNKKITGLKINRPGSNYMGLFGRINGGTVENVGVVNADITGADIVGGVAGYVNGTVKNCYSSGSVSGSSSNVGGVVGLVNNNGIVENCVALNSSVSGTNYVGRVAGKIETGVLSNNYAFSRISGTWENKGLNEQDGENVTAQELFAKSFWTAAENWNDSPWDESVWIFADGKLPVLKGLEGLTEQNGDGGLYLLVRDIQYAKVELDKTSFTYDGSPQRPVLTVDFDGETLTEGTDYTVSVISAGGYESSDGIEIGTYNIKLTATGNFTGTVSTAFSIEKGNPPSDVQRTIEVFEKYRHNYEVKLTELLPGVTGTLGTVTFHPAIDENSAGLLDTLNYTSGDTLTLPVNAVSGVGKTAKAKVKVESTNYEDFNIVLTVETTVKQTVNISGVTMTGGVYNGSPYEYTGTPVFTLSSDGSPVNIENFTVLYQSTDGGGYSSSTAPTNAGEYMLTISVPDSSDIAYVGSQSYPFTIEKCPVKIKAEDKTMTSGGTLPAFTYIVEGQLSGDTALVGTPTLSCAANGRTPGSYPITVDLTGVSYTANYRAADPAFENGTLTVNPLSGVGGSSRDKDDSSDERRSTPVETVKIEIKVSGNIVTAIVTVKAEIYSSGRIMAAFSQAQISEAIDKAMTEAEKLGEGAITRIVLNVEAPESATTVQTSIPKDAVNNALKSGISSLTISTPAGNVTFDSDTLSGLSEEAEGNLKITITRVEASSLSPEALRIIGDRPVYDITVNGGSKEISRFEGEVTVSVPYTPKEGEDINAIVIYYINASGEPEVVTNGIYNPETGMVTFTTRHFSLYGVGYNKISFKDVAESAWYSKAVTFISAREITTGTGGGNFSPEANLTRGQFMVMLMKAYGIAPDPDPKDNFADAGNTYYTGYLAAAKRLNISKGVGNNMFEPEKDITRQEMFTLLYNELKAMGKLLEGTDGKPLSGFDDTDSIAPWAYDAMKYMAERGIISGNGGKLNPTGTTTRGEMAQVLYNLLSNI